jgi:hypothetical protein
VNVDAGRVSSERTTNLWAGVVLAAGIVAAPALAQSTIEQRRPAPADGVVEIENVSGSVQVRGWSRNEVEVTGELGRGAERLDLEGTERISVVRVVLPDRCRRCEGSDIVVRVPRGSRLDVGVVSADVDVRDVDGAVAISSVSGEITVAGKPAEVRAKSVSGSIGVSAVAAPVRATAISGDVTLRGVTGVVEASSVSGEVLVSGGSISSGDLGTTSGSVRFRGDLAADARLTAASVSGDVELVLPADAGARFEVGTFSGEIENQLGPPARRTSRYTTEKELSFTIGSGRAHIEAKSFSGSIRLVRR